MFVQNCVKIKGEFPAYIQPASNLPKGTVASALTSRGSRSYFAWPKSLLAERYQFLL